MPTRKNIGERDPVERIKWHGFHKQVEIDAIYQAARSLSGNLLGNIDAVASLIRPATADILARAEEIQTRYRQ